MQYTKITIIVFLALFIFFHHSDAWFSRRRRRRQCSPRACEVSSWSSWSSCSAEKCVNQGSQHRTRTEVSSPSCGGTECPELDETRQCYGTRSVDCQLSSWSEWSACSTLCGVSGIQSSARHRIVTEQCGGRCTSTFRKTRACLELSCQNGGSLKEGTCFCKEGHSGVCCEKGQLKGKSNTGALVGQIFGGIVCCCVVGGIIFVLYRCLSKYIEDRNNRVVNISLKQ